MIQSIQKVIKIGSSGGVIIPAKDLKRQNISIGDEVEVIVRPLRNVTSENRTVITTAQTILTKYRQDFKNLSDR